MTEKQSLWRNQNVPANFRATYDKAITGRKPLAAIRAKCQDCQNWQLAEIRNCRIEWCPLWPYRMGKRARLPEGQSTRKAPNNLRRFKKKPADGSPVGEQQKQAQGTLALTQG